MKIYAVLLISTNSAGWTFRETSVGPDFNVTSSCQCTAGQDDRMAAASLAGGHAEKVERSAFWKQAVSLSDCQASLINSYFRWEDRA